MIEKKIITFLGNNYDIVEERLWESKRSRTRFSKFDYIPVLVYVDLTSKMEEIELN